MARPTSTRTYRYSSSAFVNTNSYQGAKPTHQRNYPVAHAKQSHYGSAADNRRDRMREIRDLRYDNTFLSQDRVDQIFGVELDSQYCNDGEEVAESGRQDFYYKSDEYNEGYQYSLALENVDEVEAKLVRAIRKYREATAKMAGMALLWHDLMEDLEDNPHLQEAFDRFHMLRKLSGGTC